MSFVRSSTHTQVSSSHRRCRAALGTSVRSTRVQAAVAAPEVHAQHAAPAGQGVGFYTGDDVYLYCDDMKVEDCRLEHLAALKAAGIPQQPMYLYSKAKLTANYNSYKEAFGDLPHIIGYAVKANNNLPIMKHLQSLGSGAVLVSGNELKLAMAAGFDTTKTVLNGNGKLPWELEEAARQGVLINVDSEFDLANIIAAAKTTQTPVKVLLRINPDIDPKVHPYISTGLASSKFGIRNETLQDFLDAIKAEPLVELVGAHCHLGSTLASVQPFYDAAAIMCDLCAQIKNQGFPIEYLNFGGGLGIDYTHSGQVFPTPRELLDTIREQAKEMGLTVIIEPGRSMVATAAALVNTITGVKSNGTKDFIVTDGSMSSLIRPSLYDAYQHIELTKPSDGPVKTFDVVGPVCESADFLGKDRVLSEPAAGDGIVVHDTGAYGMVMASQYNLQMPPAEYWVEDGKMKLIRRATTLEDFTQLFDV